MLNTSILTGTSLLVLTINSSDPVLTADLANTIAQQLIERSPSNLTTGQQAQIDYATSQIDALDQQLQQQRQSLNSINTQLENTTDPQEISRLTDLRTSLTEQTTQAAAAIAQFQSTISSIQQRTNALDIVQRASIPTSPQGSGTVSAVILGAVVGVALAGGVILLIKSLDDRIKTTEIATQLLQVPVLGAIPSFGNKKAPYVDRLVMKEDSISPHAEAYRRLQTNLMFAAKSERKSVFVITSAGPEEGKSVTAANLSVTLANRGLRVLLIDADLHRPVQHQIFGLENEVGLSTLLLADSENAQKSESEREKQTLKQLDQCIQITEITNLRVITSGFVPSNPAQVLGSSLMKRWIDAFRSANNIDIVIIDTPPVLLFADATIVGTITEAEALLVLDSQRARTQAALKAKERLTEVGMEVKGLILNRVNPRDEMGSYGYGYGYGYGYKYYASEPEPKKERRGLFGLRR